MSLSHSSSAVFVSVLSPLGLLQSLVVQHVPGDPVAFQVLVLLHEYTSFPHALTVMQQSIPTMQVDVEPETLPRSFLPPKQQMAEAETVKVAKRRLLSTF